MKHRIVTAAQMKEIEQAGDAHGLPYLQMMENAGLAAYAELQKQFPHPGRLLVVCGKGNNGGDGFVIARAAAKDGWNVTVLLAEGEPKTSDAIRNFERLHSLPVHICTDGSVLETQSFAAVVDALYGTGFHGELRPSGLATCGLIRHLHKGGAFVLAVDLPSGINTDTGKVADGAAHADLTVTFDSYKPLHIAESLRPCAERSSVPTLAFGTNGTRNFDEGLPLRKSVCTQKSSCKRLTTGRSPFISYSFVIHRPCRLQ